MIIIRKAIQQDKEQIKEIRPQVVEFMKASNLTQWDDEYPSEELLMQDLDRDEMYVALIDDKVAGYVTVNDEMPEEYNEIPFEFMPKKCVHRLSINPKFIKQGIATQIMEYVHNDLKKQDYSAVCLDTCEDNIGALKLYKNLGYITRGHVIFEKKAPMKFPVMEKKLL
jgi:ribosomal protein S18 acetylase RimI-like enzyme